MTVNIIMRSLQAQFFFSPFFLSSLFSSLCLPVCDIIYLSNSKRLVRTDILCSVSSLPSAKPVQFVCPALPPFLSLSSVRPIKKKPSSGSIPSLEQLNSPYLVELSLSSSSASGVVLFESKAVSVELNQKR